MAETATTTGPTPAEKAAKTRAKNATKRSTSAKKAAETRAANRGSAARSTTATKAKATAARGRRNAAEKAADAKQEIKTPVGRSVEMAEKAVFVPVGAMLVARESVASSIDELRATYSTRAKTKRELRRFERRGESAVKRVEGPANAASTLLERELQVNRTRMEKELRAMLGRTQPIVRNAELVGARVENVVQSGRTVATQASTRVQERISALV